MIRRWVQGADACGNARSKGKMYIYIYICIYVCPLSTSASLHVRMVRPLCVLPMPPTLCLYARVHLSMRVPPVWKLPLLLPLHMCALFLFLLLLSPLPVCWLPLPLPLHVCIFPPTP